jgi:glycosyltransferase involved in cell wall biosynthesis
MKVLLVHNRYRSAQPSGENAVVDDEAALLARAGCEVSRLEVESDEIATWPAVKRATLPGRVVWSRSGARLVREAIEETSPDVVHFHNTFPLLSPAALRAARRAGPAVVQTLHNFRPLCPAGTFLRDGKVCEDCLGHLPLPAVRHGCYRDSSAATVPLATMIAVHRAAGTWSRSVDAYVVPSEFTRGRYIAAGWDPELLELKPNTVVDPQLPRTDARGGFVFLGRLSGEKGVDTLLRAFAEAFPAGEERLFVAGSGELEGELRTAAAGVPGVEFLGQLGPDEARRLVAGAQALVVPSRWYEVAPRVIVEAYALGTPVVASRLGSLAEVVEHERTGLVHACDSVPELASALRRLAADPQLRADLGRGAREAYEQKYAPGVVTERLLAIYRRALARRAAASFVTVPEAADA